MGRHGLVIGCQLFAITGNLVAVVYCCLIFVAAKEKWPEILVELNLSVCGSHVAGSA